MKAHKVTLVVLNFENIPEDELKFLVADNELCCSVKEMETVDIGEWYDDHELNKRNGDWKKFFKGESQ